MKCYKKIKRVGYNKIILYKIYIPNLDKSVCVFVCVCVCVFWSKTCSVFSELSSVFHRAVL